MQGPCHQIAPVFEQLSRTHPQAAFAKVDVEAVQDVAQIYNISAMPTFVFIRNKATVETVSLFKI
jgi:thioredoxin 1